jgi:mannose-6-phosphate isomerase-like protein (cupin superfamily)
VYNYQGPPLHIFEFSKHQKSFKVPQSLIMSITRQSLPPASQESYVIPQLEGERITIPGSKGVFRILASAKQTNNKIAVFTSGAVLSDAPGFHYHNEAHDVFLVTKGYLKLWNGDRCRIMGPGDFAYVPPVSLAIGLNVNAGN